MMLIRAAALAAALAVAATSQPAPEYRYSLSPWSDCSDDCGVGVQRRALRCLKKTWRGEHAILKRVRPARCEALGLPKPKGELLKDCFGSSVLSYCQSCEGRRCMKCAPGFDVGADGACTNPGLALVMELAVLEEPTVHWQEEWRGQRKLDSCLRCIFAAAGGAAKAHPTAYGVTPSPGRGTAIYATAPVPQGVSAGGLRLALQANFTPAAASLHVGHVRRAFGCEAPCPKGLSLTSAAPLCPKAQPMGDDGTCGDPLLAFKARAMLLGKLVGLACCAFVLGTLVWCWCERRYRIRELSRLMEYRDGQLQMREA